MEPPAADVACRSCGGTHTKRGMTRHLQACIPSHLDELQRADGEAASSYHLAVDGGGPFVLHLLVDGAATLKDVDQYLRDTWLECCGHLSAFRIDDTSYPVSPMYDEDRDMSIQLARALDEGMSFEHEYDYGSTTYLELRVARVYEGAKPSAKVQLLARNEMPAVACEDCGEREATRICTDCYWDGYGFVCDACAPEHECGEEMMLPFVNSPRTGICGYVG